MDGRLVRELPQEILHLHLVLGYGQSLQRNSRFFFFLSLSLYNGLQRVNESFERKEGKV